VQSRHLAYVPVRSQESDLIGVHISTIWSSSNKIVFFSIIFDLFHCTSYIAPNVPCWCNDAIMQAFLTCEYNNCGRFSFSIIFAFLPLMVCHCNILLYLQFNLNVFCCLNNAKRINLKVITGFVTR
jgi:hypothetical protein